MSDDNNKSRKNPETDETQDADNSAKAAREGVEPAKEIGGADGPDPTRYGDWEMNGRCVDF